MRQILNQTDILACGVWHKAPNKLSSLDEAIAALGKDCIIVNGSFFNTKNDTPASAYSIAKVDYDTGGSQYGFGFADNTMRYSYLRQDNTDFIGAYPMYMVKGMVGGNVKSVVYGKDDGQVTARTVIGLMGDGSPYLETSTASTISAALFRAGDAGCTHAINLDGGGIKGQAEAARLGIARALCEIDAERRPLLKKNGFLTRDSREVERKKPGQPGARKRFQFSKR